MSIRELVLLVRVLANLYGIDPSYAECIAARESRFDMAAVGDGGAAAAPAARASGSGTSRASRLLCSTRAWPGIGRRRETRASTPRSARRRPCTR
jgi:hypothetical protein